MGRQRFPKVVNRIRFTDRHNIVENGADFGAGFGIFGQA
jgi:hypothetical protein